MELGLVYTPIMAVPPKQRAFDLSGYCTSKCTQTVRIRALCTSLPHPCFRVTLCVDYLGLASWRNLRICVTAAHPPGGSRGEDGVGEGGAGAGGGAGRPALQCPLPGTGGTQRTVFGLLSSAVGVETELTPHLGAAGKRGGGSFLPHSSII